MLLSSSILHVLLYLSSWAWGTTAIDHSQEHVVRDFFGRNGTNATSGSSHTNNWAVLVCASRYWFNYRVGMDPIVVTQRKTNEYHPQHMANALGMYAAVVHNAPS